jgi:hypothetical protein
LKSDESEGIGNGLFDYAVEEYSGVVAVLGMNIDIGNGRAEG